MSSYDDVGHRSTPDQHHCWTDVHDGICMARVGEVIRIQSENLEAYREREWAARAGRKHVTSTGSRWKADLFSAIGWHWFHESCVNCPSSSFSKMLLICNAYLTPTQYVHDKLASNINNKKGGSVWLPSAT